MEYGSTERKYDYESGKGSDPTLGAAFVAFYIILLRISSTKQKTKDHHNKAVVLINYLFCLLYYKKRLVLKMNSCTAKNTCLFSSTEMPVLPYKITSNVGWQKVEIVFKRTWRRFLKAIASKKEVISIFNGPAFTQWIVDDVFQKEVIV